MAFTLSQPLYGQGGSYNAQQDRLFIKAATVTPGVRKLTAPSAGVMTGDLAVTAGTGVVNIAAGEAIIPSSTANYGYYFAYNDGSTPSTAFTTNGSVSTRIDLVCVTVTDTGAAPSVAFNVVPGTAGAGVPATPSNSIVLAQVNIPGSWNAGQAITAGMIVDVRQKAFVPDLSVQSTPSTSGTIATQVPSPTDGQMLYSSVGKHPITYNASTAAFEQVAPTAGFRNAIINGEFLINQRGLNSSGQVGGVALASGQYGFDRWRFNFSGGTVTYSAQTFTVGNAIAGYEPTNFARMVTSGQSAAGDLAILNQRIESVRTFAGQQITISFWAKASTGTPKLAIELEQGFGTGGSPSSPVNTYVGQATLSTSWTRFQLTVSVPSISGKTLGTAGDDYFQINLWTSAGSTFNSRTSSLGIQNITADFWGVQVEAGAFASPFERRPIGTELALCQRYYQRWNAGGQYTYYGWGTSHSTSVIYSQLVHKTTMRATPSLADISAVGTFFVENSASVSSTAINNIVYWPTASNNETSVLQITMTGTPLTSGIFYRFLSNASTSSYIGVTAEL